MPITPAASQTIRLFVSSTFADFPRERDLLQRHVFPHIATLCRAEGFRFLPIDLRWGVSESASTSQRTLPIIFEELARCQRESPDFCFLLLLGDRYGSRLLPDTIPADEYKRLTAHLDEAGLALLRTAYRLDENAVPPAYVVQPPSEAQGEDEAAGKRWHAAVAVPLLKALGVAAIRARLASTDALRYTGSVTHQEVQHGVLDGGDPSAALCVFRHFTQTPTGPSAGDYAEDDPAAQTLRAAVEGCLATYRAAHPEQDPADQDALALRFEAKWNEQGPVLDEDALVAQLRAVLERRVRAVIARRKVRVPDATPSDTANAHFAAERLEHFVGRGEPLAALAAYLFEPAVVPLVVAGLGGVGKSTLLAKVVADARAGYPDALLLARYVGVTPGATSLPALLDGLRADLAAAYGQSVEPVREDYERAQAFRDALGWATAEQPLILMLDALDQLGLPPLPLDWLPAALPPHVHLIVSMLDEADRPELAMLLARQPAPDFVPLGRMDEAEGRALLTEWLGEAHRSLTELQRAAVLAAFAHGGRPLYLRLAFEEARRWRSFDDLASRPPLDPTIPGLLAARFARLEQPDEHGPVLTSHTLGLLRAAKNGLAEDELLALLSQDAEVRDEQHALAPYAPPIDPELPLPAVLWARLFADLGAYLTEREADGVRLLTFYHRQLAEVAAQRYLQPPDGTERYAALARYFEAQPLLDGAASNRRKLSEQPAQEAAAGLQAELHTTLTDLSFLERKTAYLGAAAALEDLALVAKDDTTLREAASAIQLGAPVLDQEPGQMENQLRGRLPVAVWSRLHDTLPSTGQRLRLDSPTLALVGGPLVRALVGHTQEVNACTFSPDGTLALSASDDHTLRLWDVATGRALHVLQGHTDWVRACAFSPDGALALSASNDHTLRLWDVASGQMRQVLAGHTLEVRACAFSPDGTLVLSASNDHTLRLWNASTGQARQVLRGHTDAARACAFSPDGTLVLSASNDETLRLWEVASGQMLRVLAGHNSAVTDCAFSPDGTLAISASLDETVRLWDVASGRALHTLRGHTFEVHVCKFSPDGTLAISASRDDTVRLWDVSTGQALRVLEGHNGDVNACAFSPDGALVLSASFDQTLRLWDVVSGRAVQTLARHTGGVNACAFSPGGRLALSASRDGMLKLCDVTNGQALHMLRGHTDRVGACGFSPDGTLALSASSDQTLRLWDVASGQTVHVLQGHTSFVTACALSPDGRLVLSASEDHTLRLWDVESGQARHVLEGHTYVVEDCAFSPDGRLALSASLDHTLRLWDVANGQTRHVLQGHSGRVWTCAFSPDGRLALSGSLDDHALRLWDVASGQTRHVLQGHSGSVEACTFSPDGALALSASIDQTLRLWDVASGQTRHVLNGHTDAVWACVFSPDSTLALSASNDQTLRLWDVASGRELSRFVADAELRCCAFSPRGGRAVAGDLGGAMHFLTVTEVEDAVQAGPLLPTPTPNAVAPAATQPSSAGERALTATMETRAVVPLPPTVSVTRSPAPTEEPQTPGDRAPDKSTGWRWWPLSRLWRWPFGHRGPSGRGGR